MAARGQGGGLLVQSLHHPGDVDRLFRRRAAGILETGQRQQILDQVLHAAGLLRHQLHRALLECRIGCLLLVERLEIAGEHGDRRAQFMRHVGYQVAPHRLQALPARDVAADHELLLVAVGHELHRQRGFAAAGAAQHERLGEVLLVEVLDALRLAHDVGELPTDVTPGVDLVEDDHRLVHRRSRALEAFERAAQVGFVLPLPADQAREVGERFGPDARAVRHRRAGWLVEPAQQ